MFFGRLEKLIAVGKRAFFHTGTSAHFGRNISTTVRPRASTRLGSIPRELSSAEKKFQTGIPVSFNEVYWHASERWENLLELRTNRSFVFEFIGLEFGFWKIYPFSKCVYRKERAKVFSGRMVGDDSRSNER